LTKKTAIITGSYGDIGHAIAKQFVANGINIALIGRDIKKLKHQKDKLLKINNSDIEILEVDITNSDNLIDSIQSIIKLWGRLDVLINNAGVTKDNIILRMTNQDWDDVINTNLKAAFVASKTVSKQMIRQKAGCIINISSVVGQIGNKGQSNYVASKAGMDGLTKTLSKELGARGINVNSIAPGYIETNMTKNLNENIKNELLNKIPLNRFGKPDEVASLINFLISDEASYITGQIINLDGGMVTQ